MLRATPSRSVPTRRPLGATVAPLTALLTSLLAPLVTAGSRQAFAADRAEITIETLLEEMVDRAALARTPDPWYVCLQFSSYDRDTVDPEKDGWFANWDRSQFVRTEENDGRTEHVLFDAEGPGAVVRFWATWHGPGGGPFTNGTLRFYIDGVAKPAIEGPAADIISGGRLVGPPLSNSVSPSTEIAHRGHNLYLPIPYAKSCKITYETAAPIDRGARRGEALYYQINYRTYAQGASVRSFSEAELSRARSTLARTQHRLLTSGLGDGVELRTWSLAEPTGGSTAAPIPPGGSRTLDIPGPAAIRELSLQLQAEDLEQALRSTVLEISCDGERTVWCPAGDFFGTGYRLRPYETWTTRVTLDGTMSAFWVMPFRKECRVRLHNLGAGPVAVELGRVRSSPWTWDDRSLHFHATWRQYTRIDTGPNKDMTGKGAFDANYVEIEGRGRYVGDTLVLFNGIDAWWGEGDEKVYIDGERFPSHIGTGTEDYYGYAWCKPAPFSAPFHAQPDGSGNLTIGFSVNSRYRALDAIPFERSLRFDMELWHWRHTRMNFAPSTFWYGRPGSRSNVKPDPETAALKVALSEDDVVDVFRVPGAIEGESLRIVERTGGKTEVQGGAQHGWSGNRQLWWLEGKPGDRLVLEIPSPKAGRARVKANLTKAVDYGIVAIALNGKEVEKPIDRFHPDVKHDVVDLGVFDLQEGTNRLEVRIVGSNPSAVKKHMFGLDYLLLEPAE